MTMDLGGSFVITLKALLNREKEGEAVYRLLAAAVRDLPKQHRLMLQMHFGFGSYNPMTPRDIGVRLGTSEKEVKRILEESMDSLRKTAGDYDRILELMGTSLMELSGRKKPH